MSDATNKTEDIIIKDKDGTSQTYSGVSTLSVLGTSGETVNFTQNSTEEAASWAEVAKNAAETAAKAVTDYLVTSYEGWDNYTDDSHFPSTKLTKETLDKKYTKPSTGIAKEDFDTAVQTSLGKADSAYQKPTDGIPETDLDSAVQSSLGLADSAYQKPSTGIPKTDLASDVQTSLGKADTALQSHQDISGKEDKSNKITEFTSSNTDNEHYPSAKLVSDNFNTINNRLGVSLTLTSEGLLNIKEIDE